MRKFLPAALAACITLLLGACGTAPLSQKPPETQNEPPMSETGSVLIAYFSCTGTTKGVAEKIATSTGGTLYGIVAEDPYTEEDLAYYTGGRADREQADPAARPKISGGVEDMESYEVLFLGYPIWHGQAPKIISTFLESYNLSGKTIVPFCPSASSPIGSSATQLHPLAPQATWLDGKRFSSGASQDDVNAWLSSLEIKFPTEEAEDKMTDTIFLTVGSHKISVKLEQNAAVSALLELLEEADIFYTASDYGGFEKVGNLGHALPQSDIRMTAEAGDVILYSGDQIVLFYGRNTWSYTKLGKMQGLSAEELKAVLTESDPATVKLSLQ